MEKNLHGFTLAEVLITLGIIGVVAAMTIPTLMQNSQDAEFKSAFKKMYSTTAQAVSSIAYDNGGSLDDSQFSDNNSFRNLFSNYFSAVKTCDDGDSSCWTCNGARKDDYFISGSSVTNTSGQSWWYENRPVIVLKDGTLMNFAYLSSTCQESDGGIVAPYTGTLCGAIFVDVNGCKAPNTWGKDIYYIEVQKNKIFPLGPSSNNNSSMACSKTAGTYAGLQCAEYVLGNKDY